MQDNLEKLKKEESEYFDTTADSRSSTDGYIAMEVDIRRATKAILKSTTVEDAYTMVDPKMINLIQGATRDHCLDLLAYKPGGRILDVGCGSGWLSLELARRGQIVDSFDISPKAIELAKKMLKENPYTDGFGEVNYYLKDVSEADLGVDNYDAIVGWSAFHHMPDVPLFMEKVFIALKPGGIVATMDDMPRGKIEVVLENFFEFILPRFSMTYAQKFKFLLKLLLRKAHIREEYFSPMEAAKGETVGDIKDIFDEKFEVIFNKQENAFCGLPLIRIGGPDYFRYSVAKILIALDKFMCKLRIVKGFERTMVARKPLRK